MKRKSRSFSLYRKRRIKFFFFIFLALIFITFCYWFIFLSDFFQIKEIKILNNKIELTKEIDAYFKKRNQKFVPLFVYKIFPQDEKNFRNMLLYSPSLITSFIKNNHPEIENVETQLIVKNQLLKIDFTLRKTEYLFCQTDNECYFIDRNGVVFDKAPLITGSLIKTIKVTKPVKITLGKAVFNEDLFKKIDKFYFLTSTPQTPFKIFFIIINPENLEVIKIKTTEGWYLYFKIDENFDYILKTIQELKASRPKTDFSKLEYIDCRFLPKIYLK